MKTLTEKRLELLNDTISHYNSENRSTVLNENGRTTCLYFHEKNDGCAIGRQIKDKELCKRLDKGFEYMTGVSESNVFNQLPENLTELGQSFLMCIQKLHDADRFWNETGLSDKGMEYVKHIKESFKLV